MIRRALLALLLFAVLFGLGVWGLWAGGWLPWQQAAPPPPPPVALPAPAPTSPLPLPPARVPSAPAPVPTPPDILPAPDSVTRTLPVDDAPVPASPVQRPPASRPAGPAPSGSVNAVRALAGLPTVSRVPAWDTQCAAHAGYLVRADRAEHREDPASPYRSAAGEACAPGHYYVSSRRDSGLERAVTYWATGAFHLPQLIDPRLTRVALGRAQDGRGSVRAAAVLDVRRGLGGRGAYPVRFPAPGQVSPYRTAATSEWPDPTASCAGYAPPVGAPIALLLGPGARVRSAALKVNGRAVAACVLTPQRVRGVSEADARVGRNVLAAQGAAVLLPRRPLPAGAQVRVSFATDAGRVGWTFRIR
ncbi:hypothetical protein HNQ07_003684 [Deinococcus metalli]|uniref:SCP domain-containing protein n=1 Tax=Deinococcus metalli TaxID=1141878 RepID=A0A7W8NSN9_9DEIO|nr:CAP domain-containing protein [Deinococcus metalli]MBB5378183.1 hypothetical protein [Deinococcus metalli]GHF56654.1 hypothetical protein GCM10017781_36220 [Deinococcus metalli]